MAFFRVFRYCRVILLSVLTIGHEHDLPPSNSHIYDAIVIGAGHNGLTAAAYLARAGHPRWSSSARDIVGGCCVTEEIAPGCRASTTSYIASMLRPEVIRDLHLADHGLRMVPCDPALQVPFPDGQLVSWWANRDQAVEELRKISRERRRDFRPRRRSPQEAGALSATIFSRASARSRHASFDGWADLFRAGKRFRGISTTEISQLVSFLTGSLGDFLDRNYESEKVKTTVSCQQRLRQTRRALPARHRAGPALSLTKWRRARTARLLRTRHGRHGLDHAGHGASGARLRRRDSHQRPGRNRSIRATAECAPSSSKTAPKSALASCSPMPIPSERFSACVPEHDLPGRLCARNPRHQDERPLRQGQSWCSLRSHASPARREL